MDRHSLALGHLLALFTVGVARSTDDSTSELLSRASPVERLLLG